VPPTDPLKEEIKDTIGKIKDSNDANGRNPWTTSSGSDQVLGKSEPSSTLSSAEVTRLEKEATIWAKIHYNVAKLFEKDKKGETLRGEKDTIAGAAQTMAERDKEGAKPKMGLFQKGLIWAALGAAFTALAEWISDFLGPVGEFLMKTLPKLFHAKGPLAKLGKALKGGKLMKLLTGMAGKIGGKLMKFGRFIPVIGSFFSFGFGIARWNAGEKIPALFEFLSGILNLLPTGFGNVASMLIDGALLLYDLDKESKAKQEEDPTGSSFSLWDKIREYFLMAPGIQNIISLGKGIGAVFRGEWGEAAQHFMEAIPIVGSILFWMREAEEGNPQAQTVVGSVMEFFSSVAGKIVDFFKGIVTGIWDGIKALGAKFKKIGSAIWAATKALVPGGESPTEAFERVFYADDFAVVGNQFIKFNDKDDILGMKAGGPLAKYLLNQEDSHTQWRRMKAMVPGGVSPADIGRSIGKAVGKLPGLDDTTSEIKISNLYLKTLVKQMDDLIKVGLFRDHSQPPPKRMVGSPPADNDMSGNMDGPTAESQRVQFTKSSLSFHSPEPR
jgi:hypothetical protein